MFIRRRGLNAAAVQALIDADEGGGQLPFVESFPATGATAAAAVWFSANAAQLIRVRVFKSITVTKVAFGVGTASGNVDAGIYSWDGATFTRLASSGSVAAAGSNAMQELTLSGPVTLEPDGDYFLALAADNTTVTIVRVAGSTVIGPYVNRVVAKAASFPLPATITSPTAQANQMYLIAS